MTTDGTLTKPEQLIRQIIVRDLVNYKEEKRKKTKVIHVQKAIYTIP